ncbi:Phosphoglycerate dehydrogenase [Verrucomicrobium sp. GAS474]|uniref:hydroxyacid dehydrogenase n=1 Tax=Verrucomicrobium sp. GAS474 TaxID=1882831 RepID=UPI00087C1EAC|nr:hydroxyacid dehydrogenase [Verrucomicrobium sp. GAS474]SDT92981.1 Phosphoglycerate dehydrogenase [Verrucomicrobium sp. GAS474]
MKIKALFLLEEEYWHQVYGPEERKRLEGWTAIPIPLRTARMLADDPADPALAEAEVIFSGWGMPRCDEAFLAAAPNLKAIFYAAGSVRHFVTDALWRREIVVSSTNAALAVTVAEFTLGQVLLSLKSLWRHTAEARATRRMIRRPFSGIYGSVVGVIGVGAVARRLIGLLRHFQLRLVAYDPFLSVEAARELGVELVSLEELFEVADVASLHAPWLPETEGMIRGHHFSRMKAGATFINTARGPVVNEDEMIEVLARRPDLYALLDVTAHEPAPPESPLYSLPNVLLTPHIAGTLGNECRRLGAMAVEEFGRYLRREPLQGRVREEMMSLIS